MLSNSSRCLLGALIGINIIIIFENGAKGVVVVVDVSASPSPLSTHNDV